MSTSRLDRVNRLILETLADLIRTNIKDPRVTRVAVLTVSAVKTSPDLHYAKVYLSMVAANDEKLEAIAALNRARGYLRSELGQKMDIRHTPELTFFLDDTLDKAAKIEETLREIAAETKDNA